MKYIHLLLLLLFITFACQPKEVKPMPSSTTTSTPTQSSNPQVTPVTTSGLNTLVGMVTSTSLFECGTVSNDTTIKEQPKVDTLSAVKDTVLTKKKYTFLALGDSYTKGEGVALTKRYPVQLVDSIAKLGFDVASPKIIAQTGWRTDNLASAIVADGDTNTYDFVFLLIGVNNQYQGTAFGSYTAQFEALLTTALGFAANIKEHVFVVSIPDYGYTPFGQGNQVTISSQIDQYNAENKRIAQAAGVNYIDITPISRSGTAGLVASDNLHPSGLQYKKWVELICPVILPHLK